ncbi:Fe(3+) dicitrate transport ATP-binding protein FecE [Austwickia sp. TVS 96-490-7B]|uniref:ABC transporter ATP-binding protein n=1 Tax=Austwickia sp. TVS 96-490-7B TaxID=2830843 RepID=UPI001C58BECD|nr:ABC transporter ATP-binding protein [Austwickia sp. TVS 96-490-7B]MBW3085472.1 Fe(3+) dicitrate transport ATP-binding protein FecE [Austwickia sp. TVS 96-490-7B]
MNVEMDGLSWVVGGRAILDGVSADVPAGSITAIVGPNGSGKTTLLHVIAGVRPATHGEIRYDGEPVRGMPARLRARRVALMEQNPVTDLELTVQDVVRLGRTPHQGRWSADAEQDEIVADSMRVAGVEELAERLWPTLSGGEQQRVHLARALAQRPRVLLLDEPTNHLDLRHRLDFLDVLTTLGITTVVVLHDLDLAAYFCDRLVVLDRGRVVAQGPTAEVLSEGLVRRVFGVEGRVEREGRPRFVWTGRAQ